MSFLEIMRAVFINLKANKFRVFLTSLGIIIGAFTIIMVVGIGKASEKSVADQFKKLSVESIMVMKSRDYKGSKSLTNEQALNMKTLEHVKIVALSLNSNATLSIDDVTQSANVSGISESYQSMNNLALEAGSFITDSDDKKKNRVILIGNTVATSLFGTNVKDGVGKEVKIKGRKYKVIGILKRVGDSSTFGGGTDDSAYVPYTVAQKFLAGNRSRPMITAQAKDIDSVSTAMTEIDEYIEGVMKVSGAYTTSDAGSKLTSAQDTAKTLSTLLVSIAAIVLLVGGIGIMNVLFVSVKERTKEIGILKSIGAKRKVILLEFLIESIIISIGGGVIGAVLSYAALPFIKYTSISVLPSFQGVLYGIAFATVTGIFFGYYPALQASKLKPIDALNYE